MEKKVSLFTWVDWLLLMAIAGLSIQLSMILLGPAIKAWKNRPRPGVQVPQQYLLKQGSGENVVTTPIGYLLYLPPDYTTHSKWPLVVYLHGAGSRGHDLELVRREWLPRQIAQGKQFDFILLSPQCPAKSGWFPKAIVELTEHISSSLSVDRDRVYLTGYSMGGNGTWATGVYDPGRFAAIAPLCGGSNAELAERLANTPIWAFHGAEDQVVPLDASKTMVDAVKKCGGQVKFTVYPGVGHGISEMTYQNKEFFVWLLDQRRNQPSR
jgi:predicted peptidase